jgi:hypothetical protein
MPICRDIAMKAAMSRDIAISMSRDIASAGKAAGA